MNVYEKMISVPREDNKCLSVQRIMQCVVEAMEEGEIPVRFAVSSTNSSTYQCEVGILSGLKSGVESKREKFTESSRTIQ